jgi:hypothetical protein
LSSRKFRIYDIESRSSQGNRHLYLPAGYPAIASITPKQVPAGTAGLRDSASFANPMRSTVVGHERPLLQSMADYAFG